MKTFLGEMCTPAGVYLLSSIGFMIFETLYVLANKIVKTTELLFTEFIIFIFVVIWTYILNFLCNKTTVILSWTLVIINLIMVFFSILGIMTGATAYEYVSLYPSTAPAQVNENTNTNNNNNNNNNTNTK